MNHIIVYLAQRGVVEPQAAQLSLAMRLTHFQRQLECDHDRPMGSGYGERFSDPIHQPARPKALAKPSYILQRAKLTNTGGGGHSTREGCYYSVGQPSTKGELLFNPVSGPQERWSDEASHQSQEA